MTTSPQRPDLRPAAREDLEAIKALLADDPFSVGREAGADAAVATAFDEIVQDHNSTIYVLDQDGRLIGCAQLTIIPGLARRGLKRGLIEAVRIASELRGQGLGRDFIRQLVDIARERGCGVVQLTSDKRRLDAHRFYRSLGFAMSHEGFKLEIGK
jgi:GNAT superfamily N-acetyltransferase